MGPHRKFGSEAKGSKRGRIYIYIYILYGEREIDFEISL
jgi:hypothetical protein